MLIGTMDLLAMANLISLRRKDGNAFSGAIDFEVECHMKKGRLKRTWRKQVDEKSVMVGLRMEDALCLSKWSVGINHIATWLR